MNTIELSRKEKLLNAAQHLMLQKGYVATRIDEICKLAGVTKGSFFHYFSNKEDLGKKLLEYATENNSTRLRNGGYLDKENPMDRLFGFIDFVISVLRAPDRESSCLFGNFTQELSYTHGEIRQMCENHFVGRTNFLSGIFKEMKQINPSNEEIDLDSLAETLLSLIQGALVVGKAKRDLDLFERTMDHFKRYVKSLFL